MKPYVWCDQIKQLFKNRRAYTGLCAVNMIFQQVIATLSSRVLALYKTSKESKIFPFVGHLDIDKKAPHTVIGYQFNIQYGFTEGDTIGGGPIAHSCCSSG